VCVCVCVCDLRYSRLWICRLLYLGWRRIVWHKVTSVSVPLIWRQFLRNVDTYEEVSKEVINGSKTSVIDVIGFLCVSLDSSTDQLHDSLSSRRARACSEAGFCSQNGDRAWGVYCWSPTFCCAFFVGKRIQCKGCS
jgi:hypothetical protein